MFSAILGAVGPILGQIAKNLFPNPEDELKRISLQNDLQMAMMQNAASIEQAAAQIIKGEAESEHWLAANWRPLTMVTFVALIVAKWLGFTAPGVTEAIELKLFDIIEIGLGGYVVGRSLEKIAPSIADAMKSK